MLENDRIKLKLSLANVLVDWWADNSGDIENPPYVGNDFNEIMADAALAVLYGIADTAKYLEGQGYLKE